VALKCIFSPEKSLSPQKPLILIKSRMTSDGQSKISILFAFLQHLTLLARSLFLENYLTVTLEMLIYARDLYSAHML
jgi:hypothetical protein